MKNENDKNKLVPIRLSDGTYVSTDDHIRQYEIERDEQALLEIEEQFFHWKMKGNCIQRFHWRAAQLYLTQDYIPISRHKRCIKCIYHLICFIIIPRYKWWNRNQVLRY